MYLMRSSLNVCIYFLLISGRRIKIKLVYLIKEFFIIKKYCFKTSTISLESITIFHPMCSLKKLHSASTIWVSLIKVRIINWILIIR